VEPSEDLTIYQRMVGILSELPAIGKNQRNQSQGYAFRGIDDVLNALNPLLAKWGVFYVPNVLQRTEGLRQTSRGGSMYVVNLHVQYIVFGLKGDYLNCSVWGEGSDSGDKATTKALTSAMKYFLFQSFAIATDDMEDADRSTPEESRPVRTLSQQKADRKEAWGERPLPEGWSSFDEFDDAHETFKLGIKVLTEEQRKKVSDFRETASIGYPMTRAEFDTTCEYVATFQAPEEGFGAVDEDDISTATPATA
jgi:hypothetical protein